PTRRSSDLRRDSVRCAVGDRKTLPPCGGSAACGWCRHEHDFVHVRTLELGVRQRLFEGPHGAVNDGANEGVERTAGEFMNEYLAVRQYETKCGRLGSRKLMLHVDQPLAKLLREFAVRRKVDCIMLKNQFVDI